MKVKRFPRSFTAAQGFFKKATIRGTDTFDDLRYGSPYSPTSINNPYSKYGSEYSTMSPKNPYATTAPVLCGEK